MSLTDRKRKASVFTDAFPVEMITCLACNDIVDPDYVACGKCSHPSCRSCWIRSAHVCPHCRTYDNQPAPNPFITTVLSGYSRKTPCGKNVYGSDEYVGHNCPACTSAAVAEVVTENRELKKNVDTLTEQITTLTDQLSVARDHADTLANHLEVSRNETNRGETEVLRLTAQLHAVRRGHPQQLAASGGDAAPQRIVAPGGDAAPRRPQRMYVGGGDDEGSDSEESENGQHEN